MKRLVNLTILLLATLAVGVFAGIDEQEAELRKQFEQRLRWDNVEGPPYLVAGDLPKRATRIYWFSLAKDRQCTLHLPTGSFLRLQPEDNDMSAEAITVSISNGSGLSMAYPLVKDTEARGLFLLKTWPHPVLATITRSNQKRKPVKVAAFISRRHTLPRVHPYRNLIRPDQDTKVAVKRWGDASRISYWRASPEQPNTFTLSGPTRLMIHTRFLPSSDQQRPEVNYTITVRLGSTEIPPTALYSSEETGRKTWLNDVPTLLGQRKTAYLDIPEGDHEIKITPSTPLLLRILARIDSDYLLPGLNAPGIQARDLYEDNILPRKARDWRSRWMEADATIFEDPKNAESLAHALLRNNRYRGGGIHAFKIMDTVAELRPDVPELADLAARLRYDATFYTDLMPQLTSQLPTEESVVVPVELRELNSWHSQVTLSREQVANRIKALARATFRELRPGQSLRYLMPAAPHAGDLRLFCYHADTADGTRSSLELKINDRATALSYGHGPERPIHAYAISNSLAALTVAGQASATELEGYPPEGFPALSGQRVRPAGYHSLQLDADTREIQLFLPATAAHPVMVALQLRMAKVFSLSDTAYMTQTASYRAHHGTPGLIAILARQLTQTTVETDPDLEDWCNTWMPMLRRLRLNADVFAALVNKDDAAAALAMGAPLTKPELDALLKDAESAHKQARHVDELSTWTTIARSSNGELRRDALARQVDILFELGEEFSASVMLRSLALYSESALIRNMAFDKLARRSADAGTPEALLGLYAHRFFSDRDESAVGNLFALSDDQGDSHGMLLFASLMDPKSLPVDRLLWAAADQGWWELVSVLSLDQAEAVQTHWQAIRLLREGPAILIEDALTKAGGSLQEQVRAELNLRKQLASSKQEVRAEAVLAWEQWHASRLQGGRWASDHSVIQESGGNVRIHSSDRDLASTYWHMAPGTPLRATILGPARIRIDARLLHAEGQPADEWLTVTTQGYRRDIRVFNSQPVPGLALMDQSGMLPGKTTSVELNLGPGIHDVECRPSSKPAVGRLMRMESRQLSFGILPEFKIETLNAVLKGTFGHEIAFNPVVSDDHMKIAVCRLKDGTVSRPQNPVNPFAPLAIKKRFEIAELQAERALRIKLRLGLSIGGLEVGSPQWDGLSTAEKIRAGLMLRKYDACLAELSPAEAPWFHLWRDNTGAAMSALEALGDEGAADWLAYHIRHLETVAPEAREAMQIAGEVKAEAWRKLPGIQRLRLWLTRGRVWERIDTVFTSAGIRKIAFEGWQPETPSSQIKKALCPPVPTTFRVITGEKAFRYSVRNEETVAGTLVLRAFSVPFAKASLLPVTVSVSGQPDQLLKLSPQGADVRISFKLSAADSEVMVTTGAFPPSHYLALTIEDGAPGGNGDDRGKTAFGTAERSYHLATHTDSLVMKLKGPTRVRIDQLVGDQTQQVEKVFVDGGWHTLELTPESGADDGLYRVFVRKTEATTEETPGEAQAQRHVQRVLDHPVAPAYPHRGRLAVNDRFALGRQEDGSWTLEGSWTSRRQYDEASSEDQERFFQAKAIHRIYYPHLHTWFETSFFNRLHQQGGPTIGSEEFVHYSPPWTPFDYWWNGRLYQQFPNGNSLPTGSMAWSLYWRAGISHRRELGVKLANSMKAELFQRVLSEDDGDDYKPGYLDQDVFTDYKYDHRYGVRLSDSLTYQPWLDTLWRGTTSLASNEDLTLDNIGIGTAWLQMLGDLQADLAYSGKLYFDDDDRDKTRWRNALYLELQWERWFKGHSRIEAGLQIRHDVEAGANSTVLFLRWHFGTGRDYRDYRPGTPDFRKVRQHRIPFATNNHMDWQNDE